MCKGNQESVEKLEAGPLSAPRSVTVKRSALAKSLGSRDLNVWV